MANDIDAMSGMATIGHWPPIKPMIGVLAVSAIVDMLFAAAFAAMFANDFFVAVVAVLLFVAFAPAVVWAWRKTSAVQMDAAGLIMADQDGDDWPIEPGTKR